MGNGQSNFNSHTDLLRQFLGDEGREHGVTEGVPGPPQLLLLRGLVTCNEELEGLVNHLPIKYPGIEHRVDRLVNLGRNHNNRAV